MNTQCIVGSHEGKHFRNISNLSLSSSQTVVFYVQKQCWITTRQAATNLHNIKSSHNTYTNAFTYSWKSSKKSVLFSGTHVFICVKKDATPLLQIWRSRFGVLLLCCFSYYKTNFASLCPWPSPIKVYKDVLVIFLVILFSVWSVEMSSRFAQWCLQLF